MATKGLEKSDKYPGVYWRMVPRRDKKGDERLYYVMYRRQGERKLFQEKLGRASEGFTEALAMRERAARIGGKLSNAEAREKQERDILTGGGPVTIARAWKIYHEAHLANASIRDDINRYNKHIAEPLGNNLAVELTTAQVAAFRQKLEKRSLSPQSVKHCLELVKRILRYCAKLEVITMPPCIFDMPKVDNQKTETMTAEQIAAYWQALDDEPDQDAAALLRLALLTGIRRGALFALQWDDCDLDNGIIRLRGEAAKNGRTSYLPINDAAREVLRNITRRSDFVFPGRDGGQRKAFTKIARRVREKAGLSANFRPLHGLRHVFASHLASSGKVNLYQLQKLLTHGSPQMTQRYAHLADEALRNAANMANDIAASSDMEKKE